MPSYNLRCAALFCAVLLAGCRADAPARTQHPRWTLTREAVAGAGEGEGALTGVGTATVGTDGTVYAADRAEHLMRVYDRDGRFLRSIGRQGEGPGEFDSPGEMGWRGDTLWVQDGGNHRISFFRPDGSFVRSLSFARAAPITDGRVYIPGYVLADGSVLGYWPASLDQIAGARRVVLSDVRFSEAGEPISRLGQAEIYHLWAEIKRENGVNYVPERFGDSPIRRVAPDGSFFVAVNRDAAQSDADAAFTVRVMDITGRVTLEQRMRYKPAPLGRALVDSVLAEAAGNWERNGAPPEASRERTLRQALYVPRFLPPVTAVSIGRDGTIWLKREATGAANVWWHVLDRSGRILANVAVPATLRVQYADSTQLWAEERDADDVPTLVRFRVNREPR